MDIEKALEEGQKFFEEDLERKNFDYEYPDGLDLHPKSKLHAFLVKQIIDMVSTSHNVLDSSKQEWRKLDKNLCTYVEPDDVDRAVKSKDPRKPVNVVIPMLFASQEIFLTYLSSAFLKDPIHKLYGQGSKDAKVKAILLERVLEKQHAWFKESLKLLTMFRDAITYGFGIVSPVWRKRKATHPWRQDVDDVVAAMLQEAGIDAQYGDVFYGNEERVIAEGNELINIDPYQVFLDPRATVNDFQDSQYFGYIIRDNALNLLREDGDPETGIFNAKYARMLAGRGNGTSHWYTETDMRNELFGKPLDAAEGDPVKPETTLDTIHLFVHIIPKEWGLSDADEPQLWKFALSADRIITECRHVKLWHGMMPAVIAGPNTTGYDISPVSHLSLAYGMQNFSDWLIKSHVDNVRKAINDMIIFNPAVIEPEDMMNPGPGKLVRVREHAMLEGQPLSYHVQQLAVQDVTAHNVVEAQSMMTFIQQTLGTNDIMMGDLSNMPERPTSAGINAAKLSALSRLQLMARKVGQQAMQDLALLESYNTMQFMGEPVAISILGEYESQIRREFGIPKAETDFVVDPQMFWDLDFAFEVRVQDGSLPEQGDIGVMTQILQNMMQIEGAGEDMFGGLDVQRIFLQWARKAGFENVQDFVQAGGDVNTQVMPDEQVQQQVQAGNLIPMQQAAGGEFA